MEEEEEESGPTCPYCSVIGDDCAHHFAVLDIHWQCVEGPCEEAYDPERGKDDGYFEKFREACEEASDDSLTFSSEQGAPGSCTTEEWHWAKDLAKSIEKLRKAALLI